MRLINVLAATLIGVTVILVQPQNTAALDGGEINNIARQITVKIAGQKPGTGIIVKKEGNRYTVLTNNHVVKNKGKYILITHNGKTYNFNYSDIRKLPDLDLAVVQFISNDNYTVATLGDSNKLTESTPIYNAGWSVNDSRCLKGCYRFYNGIINGISPNPKEGYALIMSNNTLPGMSGGPILNAQGELVGINGQAFPNAISGAVDFDGIPINKYKKSQNIATTSPLQATPIQVADRVISRKPTEIKTQPISSINFTLAKTLPGDFFPVTAIALSPNGKILASGSMNGSIQLWNIATGSKIRTLQGHSDRIESVAFSPDGKTLASGSNDETIKLWNVATGTEIGSLQGSFFSVYSVTFSPDGKTLASGSSDGTIKLWDVSTTKEILTLSGHTAKVSAVAFSPDGKILASGSDDRIIKLWNVATAGEILTFDGHSDRVGSVAFSPDGKILASGSSDKTIKLWNIDTGTEIRTLTGHSNRVGSVAFSPNGKILASGSDDNTVKLWNVATGTQIHTLTGYADTVDSVIFSSDGKTLASASRENNIKVWRVSE
ncbi:serine/threonine protein kinase [Dolichospermum sp. UHCC 0352]|uniref:WD40 domain-containing protein n=1 Tax=Dolichospermum sp. UHCC 0352 TaxID=2590011 RepID=UPI001447EF31|nr:trypsin-like peptidase domain-containing protein [Dolichospermum sp. UHCC 0352]MTJ22539.1 serine/threonine protein kinase [Dolichospermum sp. UHCC 0352]